MVVPRRALKQLCLKPQDLLLAFKLCANEKHRTATYANLSDALGLTKSEVSAGMLRAQESGLISVTRTERVPLISAVRDFVLHGARYAFPPTRGRVARGMPTSVGAPPLDRIISVPDSSELPVWPDSEGTARGPTLAPLYPSVPYAAKRDQQLYELLALFDALRDGAQRERNSASEILDQRLR